MFPGVPGATHAVVVEQGLASLLGGDLGAGVVGGLPGSGEGAGFRRRLSGARRAGGTRYIRSVAVRGPLFVVEWTRRRCLSRLSAVRGWGVRAFLAVIGDSASWRARVRAFRRSADSWPGLTARCASTARHDQAGCVGSAGWRWPVGSFRQKCCRRKSQPQELRQQVRRWSVDFALAAVVVVIVAVASRRELTHGCGRTPAADWTPLTSPAVGRLSTCPSLAPSGLSSPGLESRGALAWLRTRWPSGIVVGAKMTWSSVPSMTPSTWRTGRSAGSRPGRDTGCRRCAALPRGRFGYAARLAASAASPRRSAGDWPESIEPSDHLRSPAPAAAGLPRRRRNNRSSSDFDPLLERVLSGRISVATTRSSDREIGTRLPEVEQIFVHLVDRIIVRVDRLRTQRRRSAQNRDDEQAGRRTGATWYSVVHSPTSCPINRNSSSPSCSRTRRGLEVLIEPRRRVSSQSRPATVASRARTSRAG